VAAELFAPMALFSVNAHLCAKKHSGEVFNKAKSSAAENFLQRNLPPHLTGNKYFCGGRTTAPNKNNYFSREKDLRKKSNLHRASFSHPT
jgi:hypothetical protein